MRKAFSLASRKEFSLRYCGKTKVERNIVPLERDRGVEDRTVALSFLFFAFPLDRKKKKRSCKRLRIRHTERERQKKCKSPTSKNFNSTKK
jgi:hypothetical protein